MQGNREKARVSSTRGETRKRGAGKEFKEWFDNYSCPSRKPQSMETVTGNKKCVRQLKVTLSLSFSLGNITRVQSKPVNTDVDGGIESVCINGVSV